MEPDRQIACDLAIRILGPGKLQMLGQGEFFSVADKGVHTHLGGNLSIAMKTLCSLGTDSGNLQPKPCRS